MILMLFQSIAPVFLLPAPAFAATETQDVLVSEVTLDFDTETNEFVLAGEASAETEYLLTYNDSDENTPEEAIIGTVSGAFSETLYAGTCSGEVCVADAVESGKLILSAAGYEATYAVVNDVLWLENEGVATVAEVEAGKTYVAPQNDEVTVTFTSLPENPGSLSIEELTLSDEQVEKLGALSNVAYNITSSMENGTFEYDLTLPVPDTDKQPKVVFTENIDSLDQVRETESVVVNGKATSEDLNHFTVFIITDDEATYTGAWIDYATQGYLNNGKHYPSTVAAGETATWNFSGLTSGTYKVYISWSTYWNRTTAAPYVLNHPGGPTPKTINQERLADQATTGGVGEWSGWHYYGEYTLDSSSNLVLTTVDNTSGSEYVIADEVLLANVAVAPDEVWVDDDYALNLHNDGHVWGYDAFATIQEGVDAVADGGTVHVADGNYSESVTINTSLELRGPNADVNPNTEARSAEAVIDGQNVILIPRPWPNDPQKHFMPSEVAFYLKKNSFATSKIPVHVFESLTNGKEQTFTGSVQDLEGKEFSDLSVMVISQTKPESYINF